MFVSARHIFVAQDRRQTAECPDTDGDKRILKRQGLIGTQRHVFSKNSPYACQRTREQTQANAGADAVVSGGRDERVWEQRRTCLGADADASAPRFADGHRESENRLESAGSGLQRGKNGLGPQKSLTLHKQKKSPQSDVGLWGLLMLWCTFHSFLMSGMSGHAALQRHGCDNGKHY